MTQPHDSSDEFEAVLQARRRFVPRFDVADAAEPSPELDRIVLARARAALRESVSPTVPTAPVPTGRHYRGRRWTLPFALAATVLLSFVLVVQLDPARNPPPPATGDAMIAAEPAFESKVAAELAPAPAREPSPARAEAPTAAAVPVPQASPTPPARRSRPLAASPRSSSPAVAPPPPPLTDLPETAAARAVMPQSAVATESAVAADDALAAPPEPAAWLARIERLQQTGELDAAREQLAAFRGRFPEHPLPAALEALREPAAPH